MRKSKTYQVINWLILSVFVLSCKTDVDKELLNYENCSGIDLNTSHVIAFVDVPSRNLIRSFNVDHRDIVLGYLHGIYPDCRTLNLAVYPIDSILVFNSLIINDSCTQTVVGLVDDEIYYTNFGSVLHSDLIFYENDLAELNLLGELVPIGKRKKFFLFNYNRGNKKSFTYLDDGLTFEF